jgi:hypothetical protein
MALPRVNRLLKPRLVNSGAFVFSAPLGVGMSRNVTVCLETLQPVGKVADSH